MTDVFALDQAGMNAEAQNATANMVDPTEIHPGFWTGSLKSIGEAIPRAFADIARAGELAASVPVGLAEPLLGYKQGELTDQYFGAVDPYVTDAADYWRPDAASVGTAAKVLGGLTEGLVQLGVGGGNPALMLGTTTLTGAMDLSDQGVNPDVAALGGTVEGAANAAGFKIPFLGKTLLTRMATGAAGNVAVGRAANLAQQELLKRTGNEKAAEGYNPWDLSSASLDALMGLAYGGVAHIHSPVTPLERDAALTALNAKHIQQDTAPGTPADVAASVAHQEAIEQSIHQLLSGEPVTATADITHADFIPGPHEPEPEVPPDLASLDTNRAATATHELTSEIPRADALTPEHRAIETRFAEQLGGDEAAAFKAYKALPDSKNGRVLNVDTARELSADYRTDRGLSAPVHEPASWLMKRLYAQALAEPAPPGRDNEVLFTAGGTGAGKSTAIKRALASRDERAQVVYDTNMSNFDSARAKIDQALRAGKRATVVYVSRDPSVALSEGALKRSMRQERQDGSGRTVPVEEHINTHVGSNEAIRELAVHYANDPRVEIIALDNRGTAEQVHPVPLADLPRLDYNNVREQVTKTLEAEHAAGRISQAVYRGFKGPDVQAVGKGSPPGEGAVRRDQGQPADALDEGGAPKEGADADVQSARQVLTEFPDLRAPSGEVTADNEAIVGNAAELMAQTDTEIAAAKEQGKAFAAAADCAMQKGLQ